MSPTIDDRHFLKALPSPCCSANEVSGESTQQTPMLSLFNVVLRASLGARPLPSGLASSGARLSGAPRLLLSPTAVRMLSSEFSDLARGGQGYGAAVANGYQPPVSDGLGPAGVEEAPSAKQVSYAHTLAQNKGIAVPESALKSRRACSEFIEQHAPAGGLPSATQGGAPSEKQIMFAQQLAAEASVEIPHGTLESAELCSRFIEERIVLNGPLAPRRPSDKQLAFAESLATQRGTAVPQGALSDGAACSAFIESMLAQPPPAMAGGAPPMGARPPSAMAAGAPPMGARPPSDKQLAFARTLAAKSGAEVPPAALQSAADCSAFIEAQLGPSVRPSEKQLLYAVTLAREARLGLDHAVLVDKAACTSFISAMLAAKGDAAVDAYGMQQPAQPAQPPYPGAYAPQSAGGPAGAVSRFGGDDVDPATWDMPGGRRARSRAWDAADGARELTGRTRFPSPLC